jgi:hypothetical protein
MRKSHIISYWRWKYRTFSIRVKVAVNCFHLLRSFHQKESAQFIPHSLQICAGGWHATNVNYFARSGWNKKNSSSSFILVLHYIKVNFIVMLGLPFRFVDKRSTVLLKSALVFSNSFLVSDGVVRSIIINIFVHRNISKFLSEFKT